MARQEHRFGGKGGSGQPYPVVDASTPSGHQFGGKGVDPLRPGGIYDPSVQGLIEPPQSIDAQADEFLAGLDLDAQADAFLASLKPKEKAGVLDHVQEFVRAVPRGALQAGGGIVAAMQSIGERVMPPSLDRDLAVERGFGGRSAGEVFQRAAVEGPVRDIPPDPRLEGSLTRAVGEGIGQAGVYGTVGAATGMLGLGAAGTAAAIGGVGALSQFSSGYFDALAHGTTPDKAFEAALANAPAGLLEGIPLGGQVMRVLGRANAGGGLGRVLVRALTEGGEGAAQEIAQRGWADVVAKHVAAYEPDRKILEDAFRQDALPGFLVSALLSGTSQALARGSSDREPSTVESKSPQSLQSQPGVTYPQPVVATREVSQEEMRQRVEAPSILEPTPAAQEHAGATQAQTAPQAAPEAQATPVTSQASQEAAAPAQEAQAAQEEFDPWEPPPPPDYRLHEMTTEEINAEIAAIEAREDAAFRRILPDASDDEIQKVRVRSNRDGGQEIERLMAQRGMGMDSPEWKALFQQDDPRELRRLVTDMVLAEAETRTADDVASDIGAKIGTIQGAMRKIQAGEPLDFTESAAMAVARASSSAAMKAGIAESDILKAIAKRLARMGYKPDDVVELFGPFFGVGKKAPPAPTPSAPTSPPAAPSPRTLRPPAATGRQLAQPGAAQAPPSPEASSPAVESPQAASQPLPIEPAALQEEVSRRVTSLRNAVGEAEAEKAGVELPETERHSWEAANQEAADRLAKDPLAGHRLVESYVKSPRPLTDTEQFVVLREKARVLMLRDELEKQIIAAHAAGDALLQDELSARIKRAQDDIASILKAAKSFGSESGRSLAARKADILEDWSLAMMEQRRSAANRGAPLTEAQQQEVRDLHRKLQEAQARFDQYVAEVEIREAKRAKEKSVQRDLRRETRERRSAASRKRIDELFGELAAATGRQANVGVDPKVARIVGQLAIEHVKLGVNEFAMWADEMVARAGEAVRPYLQDAWSDAQKSEDPAVKRAKARMRREAERIQTKLDEGDFSKKPKAEPPQLDEEGIKLLAEVERLRRIFHRKVEQDRRENRTRFQKALGAAREYGIDLPRAVITSFDLSAVLRQGGMLSMSNPLESARAVRRMLQAVRSEQRALEIDLALRRRPLAMLGERAGLDLTDLDGTLRTSEEELHSQVSDKIPGVSASNRAFATFLNVQRAMAFDAMVNALPGEATAAEAKAIANFVNVATGRGNVDYIGKYLHGLQALLWSPRLLISRFQLLAGQPLYRGSARTRKLVARQYARSLLGLATVYALSSLIPGVEIEEDPRSSDFGKIRFGNTRVDPLAGLSQVTTFITRMALGETKRLSGKVASLDPDKRGYKGDSRLDVLERFARTKLSPTLGILADVLHGENVVGEKVTPGTVATNLLVPLSFQDIADVIEEHGVPAGTALGLASLLGWGVQNYEAKR